MRTDFLFLCLVCLLTVSCRDSQPTVPPPNIIWLVAEDIGPALNCYGDERALTPNLDRLATQSLIYDQALATAPICAPSRSTLMSGLYATSLGTQHLRCSVPFPEALKTLPEHLRAAGYFTSNRNKTDYNFDPENRWDHWSGRYAPWRAGDGEKPFFSFINVGPSHEGSVNNDPKFEEIAASLSPEERQDRETIQVPPYYPDAPETREAWARYYEVMTAMDKNVGMVLDSLSADGLMDNTIIFFFGDHGFGMPRYKRWLYLTGLKVPLIVHVPDRYRHLAPEDPGAHLEQLVSFIDFVPTTLQLAGVPIPQSMPGIPFLGNDFKQKRSYAFGARDRADDMYEMSRAVVDDRFIYIRHYMPHLPYIQPGYIYSDVKYTFRALRSLQLKGKTNYEQARLWNSKPIEELYDYRTDPAELQNLADNPDFETEKARLRSQLHTWMTDSKDLGLLPEAEYMIRSGATSPYDYARNSSDFDVDAILRAAEQVGSQSSENIQALLKDPDSGVRYWAIMTLRNWVDTPDDSDLQALEAALQDSAPSVQILAAETLCELGVTEKALPVLGKWLRDERPWLALEAARAILLTGEAARPLIPEMYSVLEKNIRDPKAESAGKRYLDFNFSAFTSWALEWALKELGEPVEVNQPT